MPTRALVAGLGIVGALFLLGACGDDGGSFDRDAAVQEMVDSGLDEDTAGCIVDRMVEEFGEETVSSDRDPTAEEIDAMGDITIECMGG